MAGRPVTRGELMKARAAVLEVVLPLKLPILLSFRVSHFVTWSRGEADLYAEASMAAASKVGSKHENGWTLTPAQQVLYAEMLGPIEKDVVTVPGSCLLSLKALSEAGALVSAQDLLRILPLLEVDVGLGPEAASPEGAEAGAKTAP